MTQFGVLPSSTSPAAKRIYEAGERYASQQTYPAIHREQEMIARCAEEARAAKIHARRMRIIDRFERAFASTKREEPLRTPTMATIVGEVCAKHRVTKIDVMSRRRVARVTRARHEIMYRCRHETTHSLPSIGRYLKRDHTSVLHGIRRHAERLECGEAF